MSIPKIEKAMEYIDDDLITEAAGYKRVEKKKNWIMWGTVAAGFIAAVAIAALVIPKFQASHEVYCGTSPDDYWDYDGTESETTGISEEDIQKYGDIIAGLDNPSLVIGSVEKYNRFISTLDSSVEIIQFDEIKNYGDFKLFAVLSDVSTGDYSQYAYALDDGSGFNIKICITDNSKMESDRAQLETIDKKMINTEDMRTAKRNVSGVFCGSNSCNYCYSEGKLVEIYWNDGALEYALTGDFLLDNYPYGVQTKLSELLCVNEE